MMVYYAIIYLGLAFFVGRFAKYGFYRSFWVWFGLSVCFTPLVTLVFLVIAGIPNDKIMRDELRKKALRKYGEKINLHTVAECPHCMEIYDISTGLGVRQDKHEKWKIICNNCDKEIPVQ